MSDENKRIVRRYFEELASGRHISMTGVGMMRIADGRVAEFWVSPDRITLMQQIGALPAENSVA